MIRIVAIALAAFLQSTVVHGQTASLPDGALEALKKAVPSASWNDGPTTTADVTCDGKADLIAIGRDGTSLWIGVVPSGPKGKLGKPLVSRWEIGGARQDRFCAMPVRVETYHHTCESESGALEGCKPNKRCMDFSVIDDACDPFNFYWNNQERRFTWWRN